jgi:hypothetical protein
LKDSCYCTISTDGTGASTPEVHDVGPGTVLLVTLPPTVLRILLGEIAIESIIFVHHRVIVGLRAYTDWTNLQPSVQILILVDKSYTDCAKINFVLFVEHPFTFVHIGSLSVYEYIPRGQILNRMDKV